MLRLGYTGCSLRVWCSQSSAEKPQVPSDVTLLIYRMFLARFDVLRAALRIRRSLAMLRLGYTECSLRDLMFSEQR